MSLDVEMPANRAFVSANNIIYFGVRNELGYFLDDIFLYVLEHYYFNDTTSKRRYAVINGFRFLFHEEVLRLNPQRRDPSRPKYLKLEEHEIRHGYSVQSRAQGAPEGRRPFFRFTISITVPTLQEMRNRFTRFNLPNEDIRLSSSIQDNSNKIAIIGFGSDRGGQRSLRNAANTWRAKGYQISEANGIGRDRDIFNSARNAINAIEGQADTNRKPVTEIYFSTHGVPYAIDFSEPGQSMYTNRNEVRRIISDPEWNPNPTHGRFISDIVTLMRSGRLAEDAIITLGGCFNGAQIHNFEQRINEINGDLQNASGRRRDLLNRGRETMEGFITYYRANLVRSDVANIPSRVVNFAYQLSRAIPSATIIASMNRADSANGINAPVLYQNGSVWFVPFPRDGMFLNGSFNSTIHPLVQLGSL